MPGFQRNRDAIPGTPGYVGESSQRHREQPFAEEAEVRPNQRTPEPLMEGGGGGGADDFVEQIDQKQQDETRHDAK